MEDLKLIIAGNIGKLRRESGMTQIELAEKLNYSDKAISKWERGESIPDVVTLKQVADLFSVSVDYLLRPDHPIENEIKREYTKRQRRNHKLISAMSCVLVWLIAAFVYAALVPIMKDKPLLWMVFVYAIPITSVVLLVFNSIWGNRRHNFAMISVLVWSIIACVYVSALLFFGNPYLWPVFIIGIPAQAIVGLWSGLRYK